ncbi:hypothetical protein PHYPSEUDO_000716 [Phytophthora pseudosyringae]|uniref:Uncharacterized protein n=1 Tax=Phytophthora pseudosyringae TaxID=221518 RepID=A0A8T1W0J3_9STRA|nr:hypothetical protein PHYPSEUDO_000716 [Phytophthora pseudosyringae]
MPRLRAVRSASFLWLATFTLSTIATVSASVSVYTGHDDSTCEKPSTVSITEGGCDEMDLLTCTPYNGGASTYYGQKSCSETRDGYLESRFGNAPLFMVESYSDIDCNTLKETNVYLADGACHYFTLGSMKIWTAEDKSMAALTVSGSCESDDWSVFMDLNASVNTGACIPQSEYEIKAVKYLLVGDFPTGPTPTLTPTPTPTLSSPRLQVSVKTDSDDSSCENPSIAIIQEGGCADTDVSSCIAIEGVGSMSNVTYYGRRTCSTSRDEYLQTAFGHSPVFMIEHYDGSHCDKLSSTTAYRADGECHYTEWGVTKIWVAPDNSMAAVLSSIYCESDDWNVVVDMNVSVNTGACHMNVKYVLIPDPFYGASISLPQTRSYGNYLWPVRDMPLCSHKHGDSSACRAVEADQTGNLTLLELSSQLLQHEHWVGSLLPHNVYDMGKDRSILPEFLQHLLVVNHRLLNSWKTACTGMYDPTQAQSIANCRCVHEQLIRGISTARRIQRLAGQLELDSEWCHLLVQREQSLYQGTRSMLSDLCERDLSSSFFQQRRQYLDTILC